MNWQSALVTGEESGIGQAIALALAREGASVLVTNRSEESAQAAAVSAFGKLNTARDIAH